MKTCHDITIILQITGVKSPPTNEIIERPNQTLENIVWGKVIISIHN